MTTNPIETLTFGGGCFWCLEAIFQNIRGVVHCESGYCGGHDPAPTYENVCSGTTGHAEVVCLQFNPEVINYTQLLAVFFALHNPTTLNQQGHDVGTQYRSVIFYHTPEQQHITEAFMKQLSQQQVYENPIVTTLEPYSHFFPAEQHHQQYYQNHPNQPYCAYVVAPKLENLQEKFKDLLR